MQKSKMKTPNKLSTISSKKIFAKKLKLNCRIFHKYSNYGCSNVAKFKLQKTSNFRHSTFETHSNSGTYKASSKEKY